MEKRKPEHDLAEIKDAFADPATLNRTFTAKQGATLWAWMMPPWFR